MCCRSNTLWLLALLASVWSVKSDTTCQDRTRLDNCLKQLPQLLSPGIPSSKQAVDVACRAFKTGMQCFDQYVNTCFNGNDRDVINANVAGARKVFARLCDEPHFQEEYLKYAPCYHNISQDWDSCAGSFLQEVPKGPYTDKQAEGTKLCCARNAFLDCVHTSANQHCSLEAARFLRQMADMLSNAHVYSSGCQHTYTPAECSKGSSLHISGLLAVFIMVAMIFCARS